MHQEIITFWFEEIDPARWWKKNPRFDQMIKDRFLTVHQQAVRCELAPWRESVEGRLAEIIVLDQFSRNLYRDSALAFNNDPLALALAQEALRLQCDQQVDRKKRSFFYLPFMHSESRLIHQQAVALYKAHGDKNTLEFELKHKAIIDRFGRYPHRNKLLGRVSTDEEMTFLAQPGSSF